VLYTLSGYYNHIFRRSRLKELEFTFNHTFIGVTVIFFALILDDSINSYIDYYESVGVLFLLHFGATLLFRLIVATQTIHNIKNRIWGYPTIIVGCGDKAVNLYHELVSQKKSEGFFIQGFVEISDSYSKSFSKDLNILGTWNDLPKLIAQYNIEDIILCPETSENYQVTEIIDCIQNENVHLKIIPDHFSLVLGMVKMNNILGTMLVEVDFEVMPTWQKIVKRAIDIFVSIIAIVFLIPIYIIIGIAIKIDSEGPIIFKQERIGYKGKSFKILKFRSMKNNAESNGTPKLSHDQDERRTKIGILLRQTRLDELPQFFNVLLGQMSLVGPRPERSFFIEQIVSISPIYKRLHRIKPGITSWGQIKYGYASNVNEMVDRMKYDILYLENMSLGLDFKIMAYTALIMIQGRGK
jgi:exopolysaccharide biosynthesis polyprenyl glycosylphosphotransferase